MQSGEPLASIIVPTFNGAAWISEMLGRVPSASERLSSELIVIDNGSTDATVSIAENSPLVRVIRTGRNAGFSKAVNQGARASQGATIILANQDLFLEKGSLRVLHAESAARGAICGGQLRSKDGRMQASCGPFPTLLNSLARLFLPARKRKYYLDSKHLPSEQGAYRAEWVTGAFMAFPREVFDALGGFDEGFFMYYEDVDFCLRARQKGFPVYYLPTAQAVHMAPYAERDDAPEWLQKEVRCSQMRYFDKHRPRWEAAAIRGLNRAYFAAKGWDWPPVSKAQQAAAAK